MNIPKIYDKNIDKQFVDYLKVA